MRVLLIALSILFCAATGGCKKSVDGDMPATTALATPGERFRALEERLLVHRPLHLRFDITSSGAFVAELTGSLRLTEAGETQLDAEGTFGGNDVVLYLKSDGHTMSGGSGQQTFSSDQPDALHESLIIGITRMGLLHNLARLTGGAPPDRADGGVREWVEVQDVAIDTSNETPVGGEPLMFNIHVSGNVVADATLFVDQSSGMPVRRRQTVNFPGGSMDVVEEYEFVEN